MLAYNHCVGEAEAGGALDSQSYREFKAGVGHLRAILKDTNKAEH